MPFSDFQKPVGSDARIWLVQRGRTHFPLREGRVPFEKAVSFDRMDHASFEFGTLPLSLQRLSRSPDLIRIRVVPQITQGEAPLRVLSVLSDAEFATYSDLLLRLRTQSFTSLAAPSEFSLTEEQQGAAQEQLGTAKHRANFWWDIEYDVMWCFYAPFVRRLPWYLNESFKRIQEKEELELDRMRRRGLERGHR